MLFSSAFRFVCSLDTFDKLSSFGLALPTRFKTARVCFAIEKTIRNAIMSRLFKNGDVGLSSPSSLLHDVTRGFVAFPVGHSPNPPLLATLSVSATAAQRYTG